MQLKSQVINKHFHIVCYLLPRKLRKSISRVVKLWIHLRILKTNIIVAHVHEWLCNSFRETYLHAGCMIICYTCTGVWACWGTLAALGSCGGASCSCWPLGSSTGVSWLPWLGNNSWGPWGPKGPAICGFKLTTCGVSRTSGCCCCSTYCGINEDAWTKRGFLHVTFGFYMISFCRCFDLKQCTIILHF